MYVTTYPDAAAFLQQTQPVLEASVAANNFLIGMCLRLTLYPERIETPPCFRTVSDEQGLVLAVIMTPPFKMVVSSAHDDLDAAARALSARLLAEGWHFPACRGRLRWLH